MVQRESLKSSWCPSPNFNSILRATLDIKKKLKADCDLRDLNTIYNMMTTATRSNREKTVQLPGWGPDDWVKRGSCLAKVC